LIKEDEQRQKVLALWFQKIKKIIIISLLWFVAGIMAAG
jgi:hypothetical protein